MQLLVHIKKYLCDAVEIGSNKKAKELVMASIGDKGIEGGGC